MNIPKIPIGEILNIGEKLYLGAINGNIDITIKKDNFFIVDNKDDILTILSEDRNTKNLYFAINDSIIYSFVNGILDENIKPVVININTFEDDNSNSKFWYNSSEGTFKYRNLSNEIIDLSSIINLNHSHLNKNDLDKVSGTNTGDETRESIISKIGYEVAMNVHDHSNISGNSNTTNKLKTPITINGISFDGSDNIEIKPSNIVWNYLFRTVSDTEKDTWNNKQGKNTDLTAILELTETSGLLRKNGQGVWSLDNSLFATEDTTVMKTGDQTINGKKTFNDETTFGNVIINGNIIQNGLNYETHAEKVFTKNDQLILRDGAITGLGENEYTGLIAKLYDGVNDGQLVFDVNGVARVGDVGNTQAIATREDNPINGKVPIWNSITMRFETGSAPTTMAGYGITDGVTLTGTETLTNKTLANPVFTGSLDTTAYLAVIRSSSGEVSFRNPGNGVVAQIGGGGISVGSYEKNGFAQFNGTTKAVQLKFANHITGKSATDAFDVGILADGTAEIRQRENLPLNIYTNDNLVATFGVDKSLTLPSLAGTGSRMVTADASGNLSANGVITKLITQQPYNYTAVYGINYINSGTGGQNITMPVAVLGVEIEIISKTQGAITFLVVSGSNKIYDINGNDVTSTYTEMYALSNVKRIKFVGSRQIDRVGTILNSGAVDWVVIERDDNLAGTGYRMVVADSSGNLSAGTNFSKKSYITTTSGTPYVVGDVNDYRANSIFEITVTGKTASLAGEYKKVMLHSDADGNPYVRTIISGGTGTITVGTGGTGQFTITTSISGEYIVLITNM